MACQGKATEKIIYPLKPLTTGNQNTFKYRSKWSFHVPFKKMASKVLNPLYLLPLCRFSLFHNTVKPLVLVQRGESVCLPAHTPVH